MRKAKRQRTRYKFHLTSLESTILYKKYRSLELNSEESNERLSTLKNSQKELVLRLIRNGKSPEQIEKRMKDDFEKMCQRLEV